MKMNKKKLKTTKKIQLKPKKNRTNKIPQKINNPPANQQYSQPTIRTPFPLKKKCKTHLQNQKEKAKKKTKLQNSS